MTTSLDVSEKRRLLLERRLRKQGEALPQVEEERIPRRAGSGPAPLSFGQERLWFLYRLDPESTAYNLSQALRLRDRLEARSLEQALAAVVRRQEALRTAFLTSPDGEPVQVILAPASSPLGCVDLSGLPGAAREPEASSLAAELAGVPFDLENGPPLRSTLIRLDAADHVVVLVIHHIAADGLSLRVLVRELVTLYRGSLLPELPIQYTDFAAWQRGRLQGERLESLLSRARERLAGASTVLELPTDRPRPAIQSFRGARVDLAVDAEAADALRQAGRAQGATLFMSLATALAVVLHRHTGQEDLLLGSPSAGRSHPELEPLIGFFTNTLVLRATLSGNPRFDELLSRVRRSVLEADELQDLPLEKLVDGLDLPRDLSRNPLFQILLAFQVAQTADGGTALENLSFLTDQVQVDLQLLLWSGEAGITGSLEYRTDLFDRTTMQRMLRHFVTTLCESARAPHLRLSDLPYLGEAERHQALVEWNDRGVELPAGGAGLVEVFAARAAERPDAVAAICDGRRLSYGELAGRSERLARALAAQGVGPESRVALLAERSLDFLTAVLAIFRAGASYLPLDPRQPRQRLARLLADSRVELALADTGLFAALAEVAAELPAEARPRLRSFDQLLDGEAGSGIDLPGTEPKRLAYVIYTSGSTGAPKGAMVEQRGMLNHLWAKVWDLDLGPGDVVAQTASQCFDISVWQLLAALLVGGRVHILPDEVAHDPQRLLAEVERSGITILETVPSLLRPALEELERQGAGRPALQRLRWLIPTGEALPPELCRQWLRLYPAVPLLNAYGPTECSDDVTHHPIHRGQEPERAPTPIGRPVANLRLYVLDREMAPLPAGMAGELFVGGAGVGRGYLGEGARTARVFVPDPFDGRPGQRLYRTGDLARRRADGAIEFLGRIDHQVKIRGHRIEPGEIEAVLALHPAVRECAVVARAGAGGESRLVAYLVPEEAAPAAPELREHLRARLPEAWMPSAFVDLPALPLTANGKLDRRALPDPLPMPDAADDAAPRGPIEEVIAGIWAEVLDRDRIGRQQSFFELGGHSLLATRVISRVRAAFAVDVPLRVLFEEPTVAGLAARVDDLRRAGRWSVAPPLRPLPPGSRNSGLSLSFAQQRLWFLHQMDPESPVYNMPFAFRLSGALDVPALAASLTGVVCRHETLRTTLVLAGDAPLQWIAPPAPLPLPLVDLSALDEEKREELALRIGREEAARPFDLARPPVVRPLLLRLAGRDHALLFTIHHVSGDGWSVDVLVRELVELYAAASERRPARLPELPVQYADFAVWQRSWLQGEVLQEQIEYWRGQLAGAPALLEMPLDRPRPPVQTFRGRRRWLDLPAGLAGALAALGRREGATGFMTLLAGFQALMHRYSGQESVVVGTPIANRERSELEGLIGFFANTLALRADFAGDPGFAGLLARVREVALGAYAHQDLPFEKLVDELAPQREMSYAPVFQALFVYQNEPQPAPGLGELALTLRPFGRNEGVARFDLTLVCTEVSPGLAVHLDYNIDLFEEATADRLLRLYAHLLARVAAEPQQPVGELPVLDETEHRQVVLACNATDLARAGEELSLHGLFERQAALTPDAPAVVGEDGVVRYGELDGWAGRIAERLRRLGIGPEDRVGICLERSAAALAALLGALRAGAAYVPLDPEWPRERLQAVAADAGLAAMLTRAGLAAGMGLAPREVLVEEARRGAPAEVPRPRPVAAEAAAYIVYTSGSTGAAKGVVIPHRAAANFVLALGETLELAPGDRLLLFAPLSFDASVLQIFPALSRGAAVVVHPDPRELAGAELPGFCERHGVTVLDLPAALWRQWIEDMAALDHPLPAGIRIFLTGGESVPAARVRAWAGLTRRPAAFLSSYGPTETTVTATVFLTDSAAAYSLPEGKVPIGHPLANVRTYVLDARMRPVPTGVAGELYLAGDGLARGYLGQPGLTATAFVPDATGTTPGGRLYRTGDLARRLRGGDLEFLGRADTQVKIRGFRLELSEVEAVLSRHPALAECVVTMREDRPGDRRLVAYAVPQPGLAPGVSGLRAFVAERLPQYMVPAAFVTLSALPVLASGKVDRTALPAPEVDRPELGSSYVDARTPAEETLAAIWSQVLRLDRVGIHDNFFELGGDSILSIQIIARASGMGLRLTTRQLFENQTIAELARVAGSAGAIDATQGTVTGEAPLLPIQHWFFEEGFADPHHFNQAMVLEVREPLAPGVLERAAAALSEHHDALRLRYPGTAGGARRQVHAETGEPAPCAQIDLSGLAAEKQPAAVLDAAEQVQAGFDLERGPLTRLVWFDPGPRANGRLLWVTHHLVVDGVSWRVLLEDLETAVHQAARGEAVTLPPKSTPFQVWGERLAAHARSGSLDGERAAWLAAARAPVPPLPVDLPAERRAATVGSASAVSVALSPEETRDLLQTVPSVFRTQINDALLCALAHALAPWTGSSELRVDLEGHGREPLFDDVDLSRTVGWFTTQFPVTIDPGPASDPGAALAAVKEQLRSIPGRGIGFGLLRYAGADPELARELHEAPRAEISFNYLGQFDQAGETAGRGGSPLFQPVREPAGAARSQRSHLTHLLEVSGRVAGGRLVLTFGYSDRVHRRSTIERLAEAMADALRALIAGARAGDGAAVIPSDFPLAELDADSLLKVASLLDRED